MKILAIWLVNWNDNIEVAKDIFLHKKDDMSFNDLFNKVELKFKEINEAYDVLSDEKKRADYDSFGTSNSRYSGTNNSYNRNNDFANEETFWNWFNGNTTNSYGSNNSYRNYYYQSTNSYNKKEEDVSKKSLFKTLLYKILQVFVGLFLTNVLWIIPFGFIICIGIIINGVIGAGKALKALLQFNAGGK